MYCRKHCYFVDLFVRVSNCKAIKMYNSLGYIVYRTVLDYYSGDPDEDAYGKPRLGKIKIFFARFTLVFFLILDMRKALSRDVHKKSVVPLKHPVRPEDIE